MFSVQEYRGISFRKVEKNYVEVPNVKTAI